VLTGIPSRFLHSGVHVFCTYFTIHLEPIGHKIPGVGLWLAQGAMWSRIGGHHLLGRGDVYMGNP